MDAPDPVFIITHLPVPIELDKLQKLHYVCIIIFEKKGRRMSPPISFVKSCIRKKGLVKIEGHFISVLRNKRLVEESVEENEIRGRRR